MRTYAPADPATSRLLNSYAALQGLEIDSASALAPVDMLVDGKYRLRLRALPQGGVSIVSRLRSLPDAGGQRDELILRVSQMALGMMKEHASTCVIDESERAIWLQQTVSGNYTQDIDEAVGSFVNALAFWSKAITST